MRASRLLQILLLLQNRGRLTTASLARELEVARRTILRDLDALTEAGLPVVVHRGQRGGIELGFNYRTRLTGLAADEAEALGVLLTRPDHELTALGLGDAATRARRKLLESLPDPVRERAHVAAQRFRLALPDARRPRRDDRLEALTTAIRQQRIVRVRAFTPRERTIHPVALVLTSAGWVVEDDLRPADVLPLRDCGNVNISAKTFVLGVRPAGPRSGARGRSPAPST